MTTLPRLFGHKHTNPEPAKRTPSIAERLRADIARQEQDRKECSRLCREWQRPR